MQKEPILVLLADDDEDDCNLFIDAFDEIKLKTKVYTVFDGVELMEYLHKQENELPHILFLDLNMPRKNGLECLFEIKKFERFNNIAIAIYSTSSTPENVEDTFVKGANVYIKKPDSFNDLKKILSEVITINWQYHTSGLNRDTFMLNF